MSNAVPDRRTHGVAQRRRPGGQARTQQSGFALIVVLILVVVLTLRATPRLLM